MTRDEAIPFNTSPKETRRCVTMQAFCRQLQLIQINEAIYTYKIRSERIINYWDELMAP